MHMITLRGLDFLNGLSNVCRQSPKEHSCEVISKPVHRFSRRNHLRFIYISIYSPGGNFVECSESVRAILVEGHPRNVLV